MQVLEISIWYAGRSRPVVTLYPTTETPEGCRQRGRERAASRAPKRGRWLGDWRPIPGGYVEREALAGNPLHPQTVTRVRVVGVAR